MCLHCSTILRNPGSPWGPTQLEWAVRMEQCPGLLSEAFLKLVQHPQRSGSELSEQLGSRRGLSPNSLQSINRARLVGVQYEGNEIVWVIILLTAHHFALPALAIASCCRGWGLYCLLTQLLKGWALFLIDCLNFCSIPGFVLCFVCFFLPFFFVSCLLVSWQPGVAKLESTSGGSCGGWERARAVKLPAACAVGALCSGRRGNDQMLSL